VAATATPTTGGVVDAVPASRPRGARAAAGPLDRPGRGARSPSRGADARSPSRGAGVGGLTSRAAHGARDRMRTAGRERAEPVMGGDEVARLSPATQPARVGMAAEVLARAGPLGPAAPASAGRRATASPAVPGRVEAAMTQAPRGRHGGEGNLVGGSKVRGAVTLTPRPGGGRPRVPPAAARCPGPGAGVAWPAEVPPRFRRPVRRTPGGPRRGPRATTTAGSGAMTPPPPARRRGGNRRSGSTRGSCGTRRPAPWSAAARAVLKEPPVGHVVRRPRGRPARKAAHPARRLLDSAAPAGGDRRWPRRPSRPRRPGHQRRAGRWRHGPGRRRRRPSRGRPGGPFAARRRRLA
jgi:hypothetical protein